MKSDAASDTSNCLVDSLLHFLWDLPVCYTALSRYKILKTSVCTKNKILRSSVCTKNKVMRYWTRPQNPVQCAFPAEYSTTSVQYAENLFCRICCCFSLKLWAILFTYQSTVSWTHLEFELYPQALHSGQHVLVQSPTGKVTSFKPIGADLFRSIISRIFSSLQGIFGKALNYSYKCSLAKIPLNGGCRSLNGVLLFEKNHEKTLSAKALGEFPLIPFCMTLLQGLKAQPGKFDALCFPQALIQRQELLLVIPLQ